MRWQFLAALTNGWLWLLAVLTAVVLAISPAPLWFALVSGAAVLLGGAAVQGVVEWNTEKRRRLGDGGRRPAVEAPRRVRDPEARAVLARAEAAAARARDVHESAADAPLDLVADADVATSGAVGALYDLGRQVDRIDSALGGIRARELHAELVAVEQSIATDPTASAELTAQRRRIAEGLRGQLAVHARLSEQRTLVLTRMRSAAIGLEGLAVRLGEISALYSDHAQDTTAEDDLRSVATEVEDLRLGLVEAERSLRESLGGLH
jgi:hypothetical protein